MIPNRRTTEARIIFCRHRALTAIPPYYEISCSAYSQGIIVPEEVSTDETATGDITYDVFLSTSDSAFAKQDVNNTQDFSQGENDVNGPFALGVEAVKTLDDGDATLVVYGCEQLFTDDADSVVSGANLTLFTNTFSGMADHEPRYPFR